MDVLLVGVADVLAVSSHQIQLVIDDAHIIRGVTLYIIHHQQRCRVVSLPFLVERPRYVYGRLVGQVLATRSGVDVTHVSLSLFVLELSGVFEPELLVLGAGYHTTLVESHDTSVVPLRHLKVQVVTPVLQLRRVCKRSDTK